MRRILSCSMAGGGSLVSLASLALMANVALPANTASAATLHVMNCHDSGVGSLRGSVASAHSGDTIDLTRLRCNRIVLTSGQIVISQRDMTFVGPGRSRLAVDGNRVSRVFLHDGGGSLVVKSITIANGYFFSPPGPPENQATGGCIKANRDVELNGVDLHDCLVEEKPYLSFGGIGGGVYAENHLRLINSNVFSNIARYGRAGGAYTTGDLVVYRSHIYDNNAQSGGGLLASKVSLSYSTVDNNTATARDPFDAPVGGGIDTGRLVVNKSTVSNNRVLGAYGTGGGAWGAEAYIFDSTFSDNAATSGSAIAGAAVSISNSTIAFNRENQVVYPESRGAVLARTYSINSSIIACNRWNAAMGNDIGLGDSYVRGADNLIERSLSHLPADTLSVNPLLASLANNGGPTKTHALLNSSPAIDRGSNPRHRLYDQRGPGFARVKGAAPDIGAFEH
jgi:hypothetical protein